MQAIIAVKNLYKDYKVKSKTVNVLKNCSFEIENGKSVGFVGLNGAGKSTTIKILTGIMKPTNGVVEIFGINPFKNRKLLMKQIGVLFGQRSNLVYDLPVKDSFKLLKAIFSIPDKEYQEQLEFIGQYIDYQSLLDTPVRQLSLGQRMRCEVVSVLLHNPKIVFFDEAFLGIDFKSKTMIRKLIDRMREQYKTTFFITSHDIRDIEKMCDDVIIINDGTVIAHDCIEKIEKQSKWIHLTISFYEEIETTSITNLDVEIEEINSEDNSIKIKTRRERCQSIIELISKTYDVESYVVSDYNLEEIIESIYEEIKCIHE